MAALPAFSPYTDNAAALASLFKAHCTLFFFFSFRCLSLKVFLFITFGFITNAHTYHHDEAAAVRITWRMVNMMGIEAKPRPAVLWRLELHKSALHVHTVASPSSMHFSAPCIQQARNRTTERKIDVINMQTSPAFVITAEATASVRVACLPCHARRC